MSARTTYALNTVSGVVSKIDADMLTHPTFAKVLVEIEEPDTCISCGVQPDEVTTTDGDSLRVSDAVADEAPEDPEPIDSESAEEAK